MGARADTYYEYLLKQWIQSGKKEKKLVNSKILCCFDLAQNSAFYSMSYKSLQQRWKVSC